MYIYYYYGTLHSLVSILPPLDLCIFINNRGGLHTSKDGIMDVYTGEPVDAPITFIGTKYFFLVGVDNYAFWMYQYAFAATAATIVAGTLAERCQMTAYLLYSTFLTAFVYPIIAHAVWSENVSSYKGFLFILMCISINNLQSSLHRVLYLQFD